MAVEGETNPGFAEFPRVSVDGWLITELSGSRKKALRRYKELLSEMRLAVNHQKSVLGSKSHALRLEGHHP